MNANGEGKKKMRWHVDKNIVPVLMFHSIGDRNENWIWASMSESADVFDGLLASLKRHGYQTIGLNELYSYMSGNRKLPRQSIVLTFDDGYLDNWVIAAPILRKYGMTGVVYVTPEFVQTDGTVRPTLDDVEAGRVRYEDLRTVGFMNWDEIRALDAEGIMQVESHALTHTWYFSEGTVMDIHRPRTVYPYPWLSWNVRPDRKPWYLEEKQQYFVPWGVPILRHEKSLVTHRYFPDPSFVGEITSYVAANGAEQFFGSGDWRQALNLKFGLFNEGFQFPGKMEAEEEYRDRVRFELTESKRILERELGRPVEYLSWPGGGVNDDAARIASGAGYKSWTLSSWQARNKRNLPETDPAGIKRVSGRSKVFWKSRWIAEGGSWWIMQRILQHQGSFKSIVLTSIRKAVWLLGYYLRRRNPVATD